MLVRKTRGRRIAGAVLLALLAAFPVGAFSVHSATGGSSEWFDWSEGQKEARDLLERILQVARPGDLDPEGKAGAQALAFGRNPGTPAGWPPAAWQEGNSGQLSLEEAAFVVAGIDPEDPAAADLAAQLAALQEMPPRYEATALVVLQALAQSLWHQEQALDRLTEQERALVRSANPEEPLTRDLRKALAKVDDAQVARAAAVLLLASQQVQQIMENPAVLGETEPSAEALAKNLGYTGQIQPVPDVGPITPAELALRLAAFSGASIEEIAPQTEAVPPAVRSALARLLLALAPFSGGAPIEPAAPLVTLAATLDAIAPTMKAWAAASLVQAIYSDRSPTELPAPDGPLDLRWGMPPTGERMAAADRSMGEAAARLSALFRPGTGTQVRSQAESLEQRLTTDQASAIAAVWDAAASYAEAIQAANTASQSSPTDPAQLLAWAQSMSEEQSTEQENPTAPVPSPVPGLEEALPMLEAVWEQLSAQDELLASVEDLTSTFQETLDDSLDSAPCIPDDQIEFLLAIGTCPGSSTWEQDVLLSIDGRGNDLYQRRAGAPFAYDGSSIPFSILIDLDGSDTYQTEEECAQAAACTGLDFAANDPTNISATSPLSVLIDLNRADAPVTNRFTAGDRSQAFAGPATDISDPLVNQFARVHRHAPFAILVEAMAEDGSLTSSYGAGHNSQGSATNDGSAQTRYFGGHAVLQRLVGSKATSEGSFQAGDLSQGVADIGGLTNGRYSLGAFLNLAGSDAKAPDSYLAGTTAQGAIADVIILAGVELPMPGFASAFFLDAVGPGSFSDDTYFALNRARGHLDNFAYPNLRPVHSWFIDVAMAVQASNPTGSIQVGAGSLQVAPALDSQERSNDTYAGPIAPGQGYGWSQYAAKNAQGTDVGALTPDTYVDVGFVDVSGLDDYRLSHLDWKIAAEGDKPGNDRAWPRKDLPNLDTESPLHGGTDLSLHDADQDGWPAGLELQWPVWDADPNSEDSSPVPNRVFLGTAGTSNRHFTGAYAFVLTLGEKDVYGSGFSAAVHLDLAGDDVYLGRTGTASGPFGEDGDGAELGPPIAQHPLSFSWDLRGEDRYESPVPRSQGFGQAGGVGILIDAAGNDTYIAEAFSQGAAAAALTAGGDLRPPASVGLLLDSGGPEDHNVFRATSGTSQGWSNGQTAVGLLVATGGHNTFPGREGVTTGSSNASVNLGTNLGPAIEAASLVAFAVDDPLVTIEAPGPLEVERTYTFQANVSDPEGDDLLVCWYFEHAAGQEHSVPCQLAVGTGTPALRPIFQSFAWDSTFQVHSNGADPANPHTATYGVRLTVRDTGMEEVEDRVEFAVRNRPMDITGPVAGFTVLRQGQTSAYQVPIADPVPAKIITDVDWGDRDGSRDTQEEVDWALAKLGATARIADRSPVPGRPGVWAAPKWDADLPPHLMNDGLADTGAALMTDGLSPPVHVQVDFTGPRRISDIHLAGEASSPFILSVEGILENGTPVPVATREVDGAFTETFAVAGMPHFAGVALRQLLPPAATRNRLPQATLTLDQVSAFGPGAMHTWRLAGDFNPEFRVIGPLGDRNSTTLAVKVEAVEQLGEVDVDGSSGRIGNLPLELEDVNGLGPVRHASVATKPAATATMRLLGTETAAPCEGGSGDCLVIDWGDNSGEDQREIPGAMGTDFTHEWTGTGDYPVSVSLKTNGRPGQWTTVFTAHVEEAFDLQGSNGEGLLYLALPSAPEGEGPDPCYCDSWRTGPQYLAVVDAAGNDRYFGRWASPWLDPVLPRALPSLVIDLAGDDDYLSFDSRTQGFGDMASVGVLVDVQGDDVYVAPGQAQGAAKGHGAGVLADLAGDDLFNPIPALVGGRPHPILEAAAPAQSNPWSRPADWSSRTALLAPMAELVQGAAEEGLGILLLRGGFDQLVASSRAQGHAAHAPSPDSLLDYAAPGGDACLAPGGPLGEEGAALVQELVNCILGFSGWTPIVDAPNLKMCKVPGAGNTQGPCGPDDMGGFNGFVDSGPRYGPPTGLLLEVDGSSTHFLRSAGQGHALPGGRGALFDVDGGAIYSAHSFAQASSQGGQAFLVATGPSGMWIDKSGQGWAERSDRNAESIPVDGVDNQHPAAALTADVDDATCQANCGGDATLPVPDASVLLDMDWLAGSDVGLGPALPLVVGDNLKIRFKATSQLAVPLDVVVLSQPSALNNGAKCTGPAIAPPTILRRETASDVADAPLDVDLRAVLADGPLMPAGCHRIRIFARPAGIPGAPWSYLPGDARVLAPPQPEPVGTLLGEDGLPAIVTNGAQVSIGLALREPLVGEDPPIVRIQRALPAGGMQVLDEVAAGSWAFADGKWRAVTTFDPPNAGTYSLLLTTGWQGSALATVPWGTLEVTDQLPTIQAAPLPHSWWKGGTAIPLGGTLDDQGYGVQRIELQLVRQSDGSTISLHQPFPVRSPSCLVASCAMDFVQSFPALQQPALPCPPGLCVFDPPNPPVFPETGSVQARFKTVEGSPGRLQWSALLQPTVAFAGGLMQVQVRITDGQGNLGNWQTLPNPTPSGQLGLDWGAPELVSLLTIDGTAATNRNFPVPFMLRLRDCPTKTGGDDCPSGAGVDANSLVLLVRTPAGMTALRPSVAPSLEDGDLVARFDWKGASPGPAIGVYHILAQAADAAGNMLSFNPGWELLVDRALPQMEGFTVTLPAGQTAVKPGDPVAVHLEAGDDLESPSGLDLVTITIGGSTKPMTSAGPNQWQANVEVPGGLLATGALQGTPVTFVATATDRAGNLVQQSKAFPYYTPPPGFVGLPAKAVRDTSAEFSWVQDRPVQVLEAKVWPAAETEEEIVGTVLQTGNNIHVRFIGLEPATDYVVGIKVRDPAGNQIVLPFLPFPTEPKANSAIESLTVPAATSSGTVQIGVALQDPVIGTLRLFARAGDTEPIHELPIGMDSIDSEFELDTLLRYPASGQGAVEIHPWIQYEAGPTLLSQSMTLRIDNKKPDLDIHPIGAKPRNGWYNQSLDITAGATDDTQPLDVKASINNAAPRATPFRLASDGKFTVSVNAKDGATPPNQATGTAEFFIDRIAPKLHANLTRQATNQSAVGLMVNATDPGELPSGNVTFRVLVDDVPSKWAKEEPTTAELPDTDGAHWVEVQAMDDAGNVHSISRSILLDTKAPQVLRLQWFGASASGARMLEFVARDTIHDAPRPAGVDAFRLTKSGSDLVPWTNTTGVGTATLPAGVDGLGVAIQFRDSAGNVGPLTPLPAWSDPHTTPEAGPEDTGLSASSLARSPAVSPAVGDVGTVFTFTIVAHQWLGQAPNHVELQVGGRAIPMEPKGDPTGEGSRLYSAETRLDPTKVSDPHRFRVRLLYGTHEVLTPETAGPTVLAIGSLPADAVSKDSPSLSLLWLAALLAAAVTLRRKRMPR